LWPCSVSQRCPGKVMKCADAKTWLSLLTATLNCLRPAIGFLFSPPPAALQQDDADRGAREIGRGPRVARIALVPQLAVERADRLATGGSAHPSRVEHGPRPSLHVDRVLRANLTGDVRVRPGGQKCEVGLDYGVAPGKPRRGRPAQRRHSRQASPAASARRSAGTPASKVVSKSVAYSRAIASRPAASAIAARNVTVGVPVTSCSDVWPR